MELIQKREKVRAVMSENMDAVMEKAQVLIEALPYIQRFNRKLYDTAAHPHRNISTTPVLSALPGLHQI